MAHRVKRLPVNGDMPEQNVRLNARVPVPPHHPKRPSTDNEVARSEGLEPPASGFEARCSIQLS
jgi:hypothetical protein